MLISYNWLKDYVSFEEQPDALSVLLTDCGLEVESLEKKETVPGGLKDVVVGHVLFCERHPDADKLSITRVDVGGEESLPIVCGAPNVAEGQKVVVALVGATVNTSAGAMQIKKAKIRGQVSQGMICAEDELGLGESHDGIMVLSGDAVVGTSAAEFFQIKEDWVFEIGLTPNRVDAASHIGVARDVAAVINHKKINNPASLHWPVVEGFSPDNHDLEIPVTIEDAEACRRYCSLTISGVTVEESPDWLKNRLLSIGLKPINNVVDVTNFVLHELGQPLHSFDVASIKGNKVVVKKSAPGTVFETLDSEKLELTGNDLMICNANEPMCMGGILGGIGSGVTEKTCDVFLESACFDPVTIRKSARYHGLNTEASFRFERGVDPDITLYALKRAALLIREVAGGKISSDAADNYPSPVAPIELDLDLDRVSRLIGKVIPKDEVAGILNNLDFKILENGPNVLRLRVPPYRVDVTRPADVVEEILRIYGYNEVEIPEKMETSIVIAPKPDKEKLRNVVSDMLSSRGFYEIMNNSLTRSAYYDKHGFDLAANVEILNPLSQDLNVMRQSLLFGGLETIAYNLNRKTSDMKLYEFGQVYQRLNKGDEGNGPLAGFDEKFVLGLWLTGNKQPESWKDTILPLGYFDLKASVDALLRRLGVPLGELQLEEMMADGPFEYGLTYTWRNSFLLAMGVLSKQSLKDFDIGQDVMYASIEWTALEQLISVAPVSMSPVARFPKVTRDLALLLDGSVRFNQIEEIAFETDRKFLQEVGLFDVYQDDKLGHQKKSYAVRFVFQDMNKTLTDKEIDKAMNKLSQAFSHKLGATIR